MTARRWLRCAECGGHMPADPACSDLAVLTLHWMSRHQARWLQIRQPARPPVTGPNPGRAGACPRCGNYRTDGRPPYLHHPGCPREGDLQAGRFLSELAAGNLAGPPLIIPGGLA